ncbi:MAG: iron uptake system protein EfeO [Corynebacterium sp.]|nr:iron uptake system protein EfeO [Corynebacterium sp.]
MSYRPILTVSALAVSTAALAGCVANTPTTSTEGAGIEPVAVTIDDTSCVPSLNSVPSGRSQFSLTNNGTVRNEFEILAEDQLRIVGERENLGPGTTTDYTIVLEPGTYYTACKTNMVGSLVDVKEFTVTDSGQTVDISADEQAFIDQAVTNYTAYIRDQAGQLLTQTQNFAEVYKAGGTEQAKALYAPVRMYYERIEPTAEAFGDIDPNLDEREADYQADDEKGDRQWIGWHVAEKDLWAEPLDAVTRTEIADRLVADTQALYDLVYAEDFAVSLDEISNGAIALLEEVATTKITGEEEAFSHTDLWDFWANVEGAQVAYGTVKDLAEKKNPDLVAEIDDNFATLVDILSKYKVGEDIAPGGDARFTIYTDLTEQDRQDLSDAVNALRIPLAQLTEAILA